MSEKFFIDLWILNTKCKKMEEVGAKSNKIDVKKVRSKPS